MTAKIIKIDHVLLDLEKFHKRIEEKTNACDWTAIQELVKERHQRIKRFIEINNGKTINKENLMAIQKKLLVDDKKLQKVLVDNKNALIKSRLNLHKSYKGADEYCKTRNQSS